MKKRIWLIISVCLILIAGILFIKKIKVNYDMPAMPFIYDNSHNDHYIFSKTGQIYIIYCSSRKHNTEEWIAGTINTGGSLDWLYPVGNADLDELQHYYNMFRKICNNSEFKIYYTGAPVPDVYPNTQFTEPKEYWYGFVSDVDIVCLFYQNSTQYASTDERVYEVVDWIKEQVEKCKQ